MITSNRALSTNSVLLDAPPNSRLDFIYAARSRYIASFNFGDWMIRDHLKLAEFVVLAVENLVGLYSIKF